MNIIQKYEPLNTTERVDQLMAELQSIPDGMNGATFIEILQSIQKIKVQNYFVEHYPMTTFTAESSFVPEAVLTTPPPPSEPQESVSQQTSATPTVQSALPFPSVSMDSRKHIYGTYIEMAFHNFFLAMRYIYAQTFGLDIIECAADAYGKETGKTWNEDFANESYVWNPMFSGFRTARPEEKLKAEELFDKHFPFLVPFLDFTRNSKEYQKFDKIEILKRLSQFLRIARNFYSHYETSLFQNQFERYCGNEPMIARALEHIFLASKRTIKERFAYDDRAMQCAEQYEFKVDRTKRDDKGRPLKRKVEVAGFKYQISKKGQDGVTHLTPFGLLSLSALFLEKKYAKIFADKLHLIKENDAPIIGKMISVYRIRLKVQRLTVTKPADALALDIINELQRCPNELFELLSPSDQQSFRVKSEEGDEVLMIRHSDRFPQLVMKYIDDNRLFNNIRFQVSLGKYFYKFYNKRCIDADSEPRVRALSKDIHGFGRLSEIEAMRKAVWSDLVREYDDVHRNTADEQPYITDHQANYVVNGNRIALRIFDGEERSFMPELTTDGARNLSPTCWMSTYELPAMMFFMHLTDSAHVEDIIKYTVRHYNRLFADIRDGKVKPFAVSQSADDFIRQNYGGISLKDIPKTLQDYLCLDREAKGASLAARTKALVEDLIEQTKFKIQKLQDDKETVRDAKQNKIGKKSYVKLLPGRMASFMAKDMMFFQPDDRDKLTGLNFRILQSVLATYAGDTDALKRTLEAAHLLGQPGDPRCNPIVMSLWAKTVKPTDTISFYEAYLQARLSYLQQCRTRANWTALPFVRAEKAKWQDPDEEFCRAKAGRYLHEEYGGTEYDKAIEMPRGLFDTYIREELSTMPEMEGLANDYTKNTSYLIYAYYLRVMGDDCQTFYNARRCYPLLDKVNRKSPRDPHIFSTVEEVRTAVSKDRGGKTQKAIESYLQTVKPAERAAERDHMVRLMKGMKDNETLLKRYKVQDMLLFLMAKRILLDGERYGKDEVQFRAVESLHLKDLKDGQALSQKIRMRITVQTRNGYEKTIVKDEIKMKDYARFYQILNDRRLPSLLDLVQGNEVDHDLIEQEFSGYDTVHPKILEYVFNYEKHYVENTGKPIDPTDSSFSGMVKNDDRLDTAQKHTVTNIRNSIAHVSYPEYRAIKEISQTELPQKAKRISDKFQTEIEQCCNNNDNQSS